MREKKLLCFKRTNSYFSRALLGNAMFGYEYNVGLLAAFFQVSTHTFVNRSVVQKVWSLAFASVQHTAHSDHITITVHVPLRRINY